MAVRFRRGGVTDIKDHNQLLNKGTRTHAEIDSYMAELDAARGSFSSIKNRFSEIETKNTLQDNRLAAAESKNDAQDQRLTQVENKNTVQDGQITAINNSLLSLSNSQLAQDQRLDELEESGGGGNPQEVIDARKDKNGIVYSTLKERLDAQQGYGGGNGGGSSATASGYLFQVENNTLADRKTIVIEVPYAVGKNEIEVFRGGVRQVKDVHYTETTMLSISFVEALNPGEVVVIRRRDREGALSPLNLTGEYVIASGNSKSFSLTNHFNSPYKSLEVFYNGTLLTEGEEYTTSLDNTVTLNFEPVPGSLFLFQVVDKKKLPEPFLLEEHQLIVPGKITYQLSTFNYTDNELEVYVQGVRWYVGTDYEEIDSKTVRFLSSLPPNGHISFVKENEFITNQKDLDSVKKRLDNLEENGVGGTMSVSQVTLTNVVATSSSPSIHVISTNKYNSFKALSPNVMSYTEGAKGVSSKANSFDKENDFMPNDHFIADGSLKMRTELIEEMVLIRNDDDNTYIFSYHLDVDSYEQLHSMEVI